MVRVSPLYGAVYLAVGGQLVVGNAFVAGHFVLYPGREVSAPEFDGDELCLAQEIGDWHRSLDSAGLRLLDQAGAHGADVGGGVESEAYGFRCRDVACSERGRSPGRRQILMTYHLDGGGACAPRHPRSRLWPDCSESRNAVHRLFAAIYL